MHLNKVPLNQLCISSLCLYGTLCLLIEAECTIIGYKGISGPASADLKKLLTLNFNGFSVSIIWLPLSMARSSIYLYFLITNKILL